MFWVRSLGSDLTVLPLPPIQDPAPVLSSPPPADVSTFLAFPSPEKLLRLGPKSSVLIAQQVRVPGLPQQSCWRKGTSRARDWEGRLLGEGAARVPFIRRRFYT